MNETLSVSAIRNGTVIDHIPAGQAVRIIQLLSLLKRPHPIMVGVNLISPHLKKKDLIKIENCFLSPDEVNCIMAFAPCATINRILNFEVAEKITDCLPSVIRSVFVCPNQICITQTESLQTVFHLKQEDKKIILTCHYCETVWDRDQLEVRV